MKKTYITPASSVESTKLEALMHAGSVGNAGDKTTQEGQDNWQTGVGENKDKDIEVDSKHHNAWDTWED